MSTTLPSVPSLSIASSWLCGFLRYWDRGFPSLRVGRVSRLQKIMADMTTEAPASGERVPTKTMKVVDHAVLFKMSDSLDEFQEKEMLDGLHTLQYAIKDIICSSVGRLTKKTPEGFTHGLFTRFKSVKALQDYLVHEQKVDVADKLIIPFFSEPNGIAMTDFECEVENDLEAVFRRGDRFESGLEHFTFFKFKDSTSPNVVDQTLNFMKTVGVKFGDEVVQTTIESACDEFKKFVASEAMWTQVRDVTENFIEGSFSVSPIGLPMIVLNNISAILVFQVVSRCMSFLSVGDAVMESLRVVDFT
ncbi:hypothetical protein AXG93_2931s1620 [Marchantia polymorpha subsp. ruderalis]|uniref:Stress-response A/B barrel domain-containing protein n=1 Tax=Marchantia polymorpha subsp. ruderalis TaxID=1480154 RepID=A0A176VVU1_MARPO|nr:hypothetical protein AXG93_2931s1620 [Marchantia polymorpha subsp. ruderalis]